MNRSARLQSARSWLKTYTGENIVAGYRKHFGIDWFCAFKELETLGVKIDDEYKNKLLKTLAGSVAARRRRELRRKEAFCGSFDQDETFSYIAGYTQAGFAYGVTWEEWERLNQADLIDPNGDSNNTSDDDSQELPF